MQINEELLSLYREAYTDENHLPSLEKMKELLDAGVDFNVFNPYFPSDAEYWLYHEDVLIHADLQHALPPYSDGEIGRHAKSAVVLLVSYGYDFSGYKSAELDDIEFAVTESLLFGEYEKLGIGYEKAIDEAAKSGLIKPSFVDALKALREVVEKERYPSAIEKAKNMVNSIGKSVKRVKVNQAKKKIIRKIALREQS